MSSTNQICYWPFWAAFTTVNCHLSEITTYPFLLAERVLDSIGITCIIRNLIKTDHKRLYNKLIALRSHPIFIAILFVDVVDVVVRVGGVFPAVVVGVGGVAVGVIVVACCCCCHCC